DPTQIIEMRNLMKMLGEKHTIILSSHILSEIQAVCDKIIIINRGKVAANDTAESLSRTISESNILSAKIDGNKEEILKLIAGINGVKSVKCDTDCGKNVYDYSIETLDGADVRRELFSRLADRNSPLLGLKSSEMTLEDIFLKITMGEGIVINSTKKASTASPETAEKTEPSEEISDENSDAAENNSETNEGSDE
ncbi:MAG: ABC transporter, partial [Oscillospiraceae bacterium]